MNYKFGVSESPSLWERQSFLVGASLSGLECFLLKTWVVKGPPDCHNEVPEDLVGAQQSVKCFHVWCPALLAGRPWSVPALPMRLEMVPSSLFEAPQGPHISSPMFSTHAN